VVPRLGIGATGGRLVRYGGGVEIGGAIPLGGADVAYAIGARAGVLFGDPDGRRWAGFEVDGGTASITGQLFDEPARAIAADPIGIVAPVPPCPFPCSDTARLGYAGFDTVLAYDVDETTVLGMRFGGILQTTRLDVAIDESTWTWAGLTPRMAFVAGYRPDPRALLGVATRLGLLEPSSTTNRSRLPWTGTVSFAWRFGAEGIAGVRPQPAPVPVQAAPAPAPAPIVVERVEIVEHPDLQCPEGRLSTGEPPPIGVEGFCVVIQDDGRPVRDGPYIRWFDAAHIQVQGEYTLGRESGSWRFFNQEGQLLAIGTYADGLRDGMWTNYFPGGPAESEGSYSRNQETGEWRLWDLERHLTIGQMLNGKREGLWRDYLPDGTPYRERMYVNGVMQTDQFFLTPE
jgi:hypothetical protein